MNYGLRKVPTIDRAFAVFPLRMGRSRIHGYGVFAGATIPRNRKVIEYAGERIRLPEAIRRLRKLFRSNGAKKIYMFGVGRGWRVDALVGGSGAERINHSCKPNLRVRKIRGHVLLFSLRRIRRGEELSYDYRLSGRTIHIPCHCGAPNCRGFINRK
jgi:uncharacterized protein